MAHLREQDRARIVSLLAERRSLRQIAQELGKSPSTIKREILKHRERSEKTGRFVHYNPCANCRSCDVHGLCAECAWRRRKCSLCRVGCWRICKAFVEDACPALSRPPYVCNGCPKINTCNRAKMIYMSDVAHAAYRQTLVESRQGANLTEAELASLRDFLVPRMKATRQSLHAIAAGNPAEMTVSEKTIYRYHAQGIFRIGESAFPRKPRLKPRKAKPQPHLVDGKCRIGRTFDDYKAFVAANGDAAVVQMDSVEGRKGGKVLLTLHFVACHLQLAFIRDRNTAASVAEVFAWLRDTLGDDFARLFPVILTDNGTEFSDPGALEKNADGVKTTSVFYCLAMASWQKAECERNHEEIRRILPKGRPLDGLTQDDVNLVMSHVNSYPRKSLNGMTPFDIFETIFGKGILAKLGISRIPPDKVTMRPQLLGDKCVVPQTTFLDVLAATGRNANKKGK